VSLFDSKILAKLVEESEKKDAGRVPYVVGFNADARRAEERAYLESIFLGFPDGKKKQNLKRAFLSADEGQHHGAWGELVLYDWLYRMDMDPEPEPEIQGVTPDYLISSQGEEICVEVFVLKHSPQDEDIARRSGSVWWPETTATYEAAGNRIDSKLNKYRKCKRPYVICGVIKNWVIGPPEMAKQYFPRLFEDHGPNDVEKARQHVSALLVIRTQWPPNAERYLIDRKLFRNEHAEYPVSSTVFG
jgi:hypothetical protein